MSENFVVNVVDSDDASKALSQEKGEGEGQEIALIDQSDVVDVNVMPLSTFVSEFGDGLLDAVRKQNPPIYQNDFPVHRQVVLDNLSRKPFEAQSKVVHAVANLLLDENEPAAVINAEMGTGKTMMAIAVAAVLHAEGIPRALVVCPPHLVYKWRREIYKTVPGAKVWILNGPDTLAKLLQLRLVKMKPEHPEFFVMGRVRMRMGFSWKPAVTKRRGFFESEDGSCYRMMAACSKCGSYVLDANSETEEVLTHEVAQFALNERQQSCKTCDEPLWSLVRQSQAPVTSRSVLTNAMKQIPTIGEKTAEKLIDTFGEKMLSGMLGDNVYEFINIMDSEGELFFSDKQARRMERAMANMEFSFGQGGYQPTEFIKRYLPTNFFGSLIADEGHEFKNEHSAQGQAFGVLARKCRKAVLLTGTLMGGYADDLFFLLWRLNPKMMIEDGFGYNSKRSLASASMAFMREHGVIKDIYTEREGQKMSHRTAKGSKSVGHTTSKGPGFGPKGIMRYVLPITVFLKLADIGGNVLPSYEEFFLGVPMTDEQEGAYRKMESILSKELRDAMRMGDKTLMGVVLNALLAWPDCAFREETVKHPRTKRLLAYQPAIFSELEPTPKELLALQICRAAKARGRKSLVYSIYSGTRDTQTRMKALLESEGFKVAVLKASVPTDKREDWIFEQVDRGVEVILTNPELVKTGLDLLEFPTIMFMQSGYNVYTVQQAARRAYRIGQTESCEVYFLGYEGSAQMSCYALMSKKIAVSQSTSGDMPESGLDVLNQDGDSIEVALAKQLIH
jgi:Helicase conserved C-terminal domain/Type III restriction enzyme, res subunit